MTAIDTDLLATVAYRFALVTVEWAAFLTGFRIRHAVRAAGWSRRTVRLLTAVTWAVALALPARLLLLPLDGDGPRQALYRALLIGSLIATALWIVEDPIRRSIERRPRLRVEMFRAITAAFEALPRVETPQDRARLDDDLAALDQFVEPATFEYVQLTRSRIVSWLDGGPRMLDREARWSARMTALADQVRPESWRSDSLSRTSEAVRRRVLAGAGPLAAASGLVLGRSVLSGPVGLAVPAAIVAGYLVTWRWQPAAAATLGGVALGIGLTAFVQATARAPATLVTAGLVTAGFAAWALVEWRTARRPRKLQVIDGGEPASTASTPSGEPTRPAS